MTGNSIIIGDFNVQINKNSLSSEYFRILSLNINIINL